MIAAGYREKSGVGREGKSEKKEKEQRETDNKRKESGKEKGDK